MELHPEYEHLNPDGLNKEGAKQIRTYRPIEIDAMEDLLEKTRNLDFYQRVVIHKGIDFARKVVKARVPKNNYPDGMHVLRGLI